MELLRGQDGEGDDGRGVKCWFYIYLSRTEDRSAPFGNPVIDLMMCTLRPSGAYKPRATYTPPLSTEMGIFCSGMSLNAEGSYRIG